MQVAQPTPSESELSRYAKLDSAARERGEWARCVQRKCLEVLQRKCLEASEVNAANMQSYFLYRRWNH